VSVDFLVRLILAVDEAITSIGFSDRFLVISAYEMVSITTPVAEESDIPWADIVGVGDSIAVEIAIGIVNGVGQAGLVFETTPGVKVK
jgi:hypothetical protein